MTAADRWKLRGILFAALIGPMFAVPCGLRLLLYLGLRAWRLGMVLPMAVGFASAGMITQRYVFAGLVYGTSACAGFGLLRKGGHEMLLAILLGDMIPALVTFLYAQHIFLDFPD